MGDSGPAWLPTLAEIRDPDAWIARAARLETGAPGAGAPEASASEADAAEGHS